MSTIYYETPPIKINRIEWRLIVVDFWLKKDERCTVYQFRDDNFESNPWRHCREWPSYNINDGSYLGLPIMLPKIYARYAREIKAALNGNHILCEQSSLF